MSLTIDRSSNQYSINQEHALPSPTNKLAKEDLFKIFSFLNLSTLDTCRQVSKEWKQVASDPRLSEMAILASMPKYHLKNIEEFSNTHFPRDEAAHRYLKARSIEVAGRLLMPKNVDRIQKLQDYNRLTQYGDFANERIHVIQDYNRNTQIQNGGIVDPYGLYTGNNDSNINAIGVAELRKF